MKLNEFYSIVNEFAPKSLSDEYCAKYGAYDNSGVLLDTGEEINGAVFSLDFSSAAIERAVETGAKLIVTHHPAIYGKISDICVSDFSPLGKKIVACLKNGISVISAHLNLDCAEEGIDESLMRGIVLSAGAYTRLIDVMHPLEKSGYGRVYDVDGILLDDLVKNVKKTFSCRRISFYGEGNERIAKVASFCGGGADEEAVEFAVKNGADVMVSSDFKHHVLTLAEEVGLSVICLTHYASENYGFEKFYQKICRRVPIPCVYCTEEDLL